METRLDAIGDDARAIAPRRRRRPPRDAVRKQEADAVGPAQVQILANDRFEEVSALHRTGKHLCEADLHLLKREPVRVAGRPIDRGQRRRQPRGPAIEKGLHVGRPELIADRLQARRVDTREKPIVEAGLRDLWNKARREWWAKRRNRAASVLTFTPPRSVSARLSRTPPSA